MGCHKVDPSIFISLFFFSFCFISLQETDRTKAMYVYTYVKKRREKEVAFVFCFVFSHHHTLGFYPSILLPQHYHPAHILDSPQQGALDSTMEEQLLFVINKHNIMAFFHYIGQLATQTRPKIGDEQSLTVTTKDLHSTVIVELIHPLSVQLTFHSLHH